MVATDTDVDVVFDYETRAETDARMAAIQAHLGAKPARLR